MGDDGPGYEVTLKDVHTELKDFRAAWEKKASEQDRRIAHANTKSSRAIWVAGAAMGLVIILLTTILKLAA